MAYRDQTEDGEAPAATGFLGLPAEYFGPPDGETALRADEMQANRIETQAIGALRAALHHPQTGFASRPPTERLAALPAIEATLDGIGETFRAQATTPRQRAILGPLLDNHLEHAATQVGRLAEQALGEADDGIVENRIGSLQQDAAVNWDDPARLRILGRAVATERRSQGERKGWDKVETEARVRRNVSDFYATAIEAAIDKDLDRAGKLLTDAHEVILPERQALLARKLVEARDDKHVAGIARTLAAIPLDPATPLKPEAYRARAEELTPDDALPELRTRIAILADTAQRHATKYWQHDLSQYRLALDGQDYRRFTAFQKGDATFARYDRGRTVLDAGLIKAQLDPDGPEARAARGELDKTLRSFETIEGRPPTMADIDRIAGDIIPNGIQSPTRPFNQRAQRQQPVDEVLKGNAPAVEIAQLPDSLPIGPENGSRGAPQTEPPPRSVPVEKIAGPIDGLSHYLGKSGEPVQYDFGNIETSEVTPSQFPQVKELLAKGEAGTFDIDGTMPFKAKNTNARWLVGNIFLNVKGKLVLDDTGNYSFSGQLGAEPDLWKLYPSKHRDAADELATVLGAFVFKGENYMVHIVGTKELKEEGRYRP